MKVAPGVDLDRDLLDRMGFTPQISPELREMDAAIFTDTPLGLGERSPLALDERFHYDPEDNLVFVNFEGLALNTVDQAEELAAFLSRHLRKLRRRVNLIVNYDNFEIARIAAPRFFKMIRDHERRYFLSSTRYSTDAFMRRRLGRAFTEAKLSQRIYRSFEEATHALAEPAGREQAAPSAHDEPA